MVHEAEIETDWSRAKRVRVQGRFLKGPIPFAHLSPAAKLPGRALNVFVAIHHQTALTQKEWVTSPGDFYATSASVGPLNRALWHTFTVPVLLRSEMLGAGRRASDCRAQQSLRCPSRPSPWLVNSHKLQVRCAKTPVELRGCECQVK
jgi:hypothetical protein